MSGKLFSVSDFARFSRVTRPALLHYDRIGLLSSRSRGENRYRYYSTEQLAVVNLIRTLQELGLPLEEIKALKDRRTPELTRNLLMQLMDKIDDKVISLFRSRKLLFTLLTSIISGLHADEEAIVIEELPATPIILGEPNDYSKGGDDFDALRHFYKSSSEKYVDVDLNYPVWAIFSGERIRNKDWNWPDRYYFFNPMGHDERPAGLYAVGHARGAYGQSKDLYERMLAAIDERGFELCGDAYEEYPLNELCIADDSAYLKRVLITVRPKKA